MNQEINLPLINTPKISETAYQILREKIISKEFLPGQRLDLNAFEVQMSISRTPLKEALARLEMEGLVVIHPRSGTYVTDPDPEDIAQSFELRRALEIYAAEIVAEQATPTELEQLDRLVEELGELVRAPDRNAIYPRYLELDHQLHAQLVSMTRNQRLIKVHQRENLHAQMARIRYRGSERELEIAQHEHEEIMRFLKAHDAPAARRVMSNHLHRAKCSLLSDMGVEIPE